MTEKDSRDCPSRGAFLFAFLCLLLSLPLCLITGPQSRSAHYAAWAAACLESRTSSCDARDLAQHATKSDPSSPLAWTLLARAYKEGGENEKAKKALALAAHLRGETPSPVYARPADLRLSFLEETADSSSLAASSPSY